MQSWAGGAGEDAADAATLAAADAAVTAARARFAGSLSEPTPFSALAHNAGFAVEDAEVLALAAAVEADPGRQRLVAYLHDDASRPRPSLHLISTVFPGDHTGVRAVGPDAPLRRAALIELADDGPWASHALVVHPTVMWALAGDGSADPQLPLGAELTEWDGPVEGAELGGRHR